MLGKIFANEAPIVWVRVHEFQLESLKAIALRILRHCVRYMSCGTSLQRPVTIDRTISQGQSLLVGGVNVPGEVGPYRFSGPITILVCHGNEGAFSVATEVRAAAHEGRTDARTDAAGPRTVMIREAEGVLDDAPAGTDAMLLLYLTNRTFLDEGGTVARLVQTAMDRRVPIALVAEQDPGRGGCPFRLCMQQTPQMLQQPPYKLFDTLAVPLYPSVQHRKVSLRHVLRGMGAQPQGGTHGGVLATAAKVICCHLSGSPWCLRRNGGTMDVSVANNDAALEGLAGGDGGEGENVLQV